ncbi:helix-turn-helix domain-containing protein [Bradyrhizobium sp. BRP22]|uniref:helix-turn-helix domain-containing protein n=1 Tax=Bradyrhizobium sp. BRP22 TaxID=2793821 RepID=UPI001CD4169D|nr:helix-turn-helix domain-containing protein [Bradyrhizobium sp. BRP22]MCA1454106.1 helix-turn-helix domain-containing protein [Bradyrhizobium sp. BRP22]
MNYEQWRDLLRPNFGLYAVDDPRIFAGRVRSRSIFGLNASEISNNIRHCQRTHRCERTQKDIRLDGVDHCYAVFQVDGRSTIVQNDQAVELAVGDVAFIDSTRPVTYLSDGHEEWLSLQLPRQSLIFALGFEPRGGFPGHSGTRASRLLFQFVLDAVDDEQPMPTSAANYMQLAVYDLLGAVFAPADPAPGSLHSDRLFKRICDVIKERFADPDLGPCEIAAELGISLRYLQKLFTNRGCTCRGFIQSVRLDQAARTIKRRGATKSGQPLSTIAYACGYRDYTSFARAFRQRFGHAPGVHEQGEDVNPVRDARHERAR